MQTIRWGIIGLGRFGQVHARALRSISGIELVAASARNPERLAAACSELNIPRSYIDYRQLLDDPELDAVSITTHWQDHVEVALAALAAGKHVLLEKPMAPSVAECRQLLEAAKRASSIFTVGHVCRFDPRITLARRAVVEGRLGSIVSMHARRNLRRAAGSLRLDKISPLMGDGIHDADLMLWLMGRLPDRVYARTVRVDQFRYPDLGWAMLEWDAGPNTLAALGVIETVWCLPENTPFQIDARLEIIGSTGAAYVDCGNAGLAINDASGWHHPDTAYWPTQHGAPVGALVNELAWFAQLVRENRQPDIITPRDAARAVALIEAAEHSATTGTPQPVTAP